MADDKDLEYWRRRRDELRVNIANAQEDRANLAHSGHYGEALQRTRRVDELRCELDRACNAIVRLESRPQWEEVDCYPLEFTYKVTLCDGSYALLDSGPKLDRYIFDCWERVRTIVPVAKKQEDVTDD